MYGNGRILRLATGSYSVLCFVTSTLNGFGLVWFPLPTPISRFLPSGVTATAVGYQPVGMKPFTPAARRRGDVDHGHAVVVGVGDEKGLIPSPENSRAPVPRIVSIGQNRLGVGITPGA